jgi:hypothetical protein
MTLDYVHSIVATANVNRPSTTLAGYLAWDGASVKIVDKLDAHGTAREGMGVDQLYAVARRQFGDNVELKAERLTKADEQAREVHWAKSYVAKYLTTGSELSYMLTHVSQSGMRRNYRFFAAVPNCYQDGSSSVVDFTTPIATLTGYRRNDKGLIVNGCGFDGGYEVVARVNEAIGLPKMTDPKSLRVQRL